MEMLYTIYFFDGTKIDLKTSDNEIHILLEKCNDSIESIELA
jgi:hypothetical protein